MKKFGCFLVLYYLLISTFTYAQDDAQANAEPKFKDGTAADGSVKKGCDSRGFCWGENVDEAKSKYTFFSDEIKGKQYASAEASYDWLFERAPYLHKNLYIYGEKMYKGLLKDAKKAKDKAAITKYEDKQLGIYDLRAQYFGDKDKKLYLKKSRYYYSYIKDRPEFKENMDKCLEYYEEVAEVEGKERASTTNVTTHTILSVQLALKHKKAAQAFRKKPEVKKQRSIILTWEPLLEDPQQGATAKKNVSGAKLELEKLQKEYEANDPVFKKYSKFNEDWFLTKYEFLSDVINYNIENAKDDKTKASWEKTLATLDKYTPSVVDIDCDFVKNKIASKLEANPDDVEVAKKVIKYSLMAKCTDEEYFMNAAITAYNDSPDGGMALVIAKKYSAQDDTDKAIEWMNKAVELFEESPEKKAEAQMSIAKFNAKKGLKSAARTSALDASKTDESVASEAYTFIGDLYMGSYKDCFDVKDEVKSRACFLAAYDMYSRAGNSAKMKKAQAQFPSTADIFQLASKGYAEGGNIQVGCWIGGSTVIRKRP